MQERRCVTLLQLSHSCLSIIWITAFPIFAAYAVFTTNSKHIVSVAITANTISIPPQPDARICGETHFHGITTAITTLYFVSACVISLHWIHLQFYMLLIAPNNFEVEFHESRSNYRMIYLNNWPAFHFC